jgi:hypothetical protein
VNERGRPLANFIYGDEANANEAALAMQTVLAKAIFMKAAPQFRVTLQFSSRRQILRKAPGRSILRREVASVATCHRP